MIVINPIVNPIPVYGHLTRDNTIFDSDDTQLVTPGTHTITGSESDNDGDEQEET
jgi:hypothetical protein